MKKRPELEPKVDHWSYLWLTLAVVLTLFGFGKWQIPLAPWLSTLFAMRFIRTQRLGWGWVLLVGLSIPVAIIAANGVVPFPLPLTIGFMALQVILGCVPYLADRLLAPRIAGFASTLVFPLAATAWEFINLGSSPVGSFGAQAYLQAGNLPLMQLVSLTGIWGITFLISWFASVVNWTWEQSFDWKRSGRGVLIFAGCFALVLIYGYGRLLLAPQSTESVRIAGVTIDGQTLAQIMPLYTQNRAEFQRITRDRYERYLAETIREARAGAKIVVWPEGAALGLAEDVKVLVARSQELARQEGIYIAVQFLQLFPDQERAPENKMLLVDAQGQIAFEHVKYGGNFLEGTRLGDGILRTAQTPFGLVSGVICWDADFVSTIRQSGQQGVDLLLIGANDWQEVGLIHAQMASFRAIENGVTVVRQAANGLSQAIDPYGRVLAGVDHYASSERVLVAQVPVKAHRFTLYSVIGDALAWASMLGFVGLWGWVVMQARATKHSIQPLIEQTQAR